MIVDVKEASLRASSLTGFDYSSTTNLNPKRDELGFKGQYAVYKALKGLPFEHSPYIKGFKGDSFDFKLYGETIDVKSSPLGSAPPGCPKCRLLVKNGTKPVDRFIFCKIDGDTVHIVGTISYNRFMEESHEYNAKYPCRGIFNKQLEPFDLWVKEQKEKN